MKFKEGINLALEPAMAKALPDVDLAHSDAGLERDAVITSGNDGSHMVGSLHYKGLAVDLRSRDLSQAVTYRLAAALRQRLNGDANHNRPYQVVIESNHLHLEYDPLPGRVPNVGPHSATT